MRRETQGNAPCFQSVSRPATALRILGLMAAFLAALALAAPAAQAEPKSVVGLLGGPGTGIFSFAQQAAVNPVTGALYVVDNNNHRVLVFTDLADGQPDLTFGVDPPGTLGSPQAIGISPDGTKAYVGDNENSRIVVFDAVTGAYISQFGDAGPGLVGSPTSIAVGPDGSIYVSDLQRAAIFRYDSTGAYLDSIAEAGSGPGEFGSFPLRIAVDPASGDLFALGALADFSRRVYRYDATGTFEAELVGLATPGVTTSQGPDELTVDPSSGNLFVFATATGLPICCEERLYELNPETGALIETHGAEGNLENANSVAIDTDGAPIFLPISSTVYILDTPPATPPAASLGPAQDVGPTGATFLGEIDSNQTSVYPNPPATSWLLEYKPSSELTWTQWAPPKSIGAGNDVPIKAIVGGLEPNTEYDVRVTATRAFGGGSGTAAQSFTTGTAPPEIKSFTASNLTATTADLQATIDPLGLETTYRFEYGTSVGYGQVAPIPDGNIGDGHDPITVTVPIEGLEAATYHFRVVATNAAGTTTTDDQTFEFFPPTCPNQTIRQQTRSNYLPDCRGYELVSPGDAGGVTLLPGGPNTGYASGPSRMSFIGNFGSLPGQEHNVNTLADLYVSTRTASGWVTRYVGLPSDQTGCMGNPPMGTVGAGSTGYNEASDKVHRWVFTDQGMSRFALWSLGPVFSCAAAGGLPDGSEAPQTNAPFVFEADGTEVGRFPTNLETTPSGPEALDCDGPGNLPRCDSEVAASGDMTHFVFSTRSAAPFDPADPGTGVAPGSTYDNDVAAGTVTVVSKTPLGADIPQEPGNTDPNDLLYLPKVSEDGSRILMAASGAPRCYPNNIPFGLPHEIQDWCPSPYKAPAHLYMRVDASLTLDVSHGNQVVYLGATKDLSKVFFTSSAQLTGEDDDTSVDLYMWTEVDEALTLLSIGNNGAGNSDDCPAATWTTKCGIVPLSFKNFSMLQGGRGGNERNDSFIASESGDIYFYSPEILDGARGVFGEQQLYVYRDGGVHQVVSFTAGNRHCADPPQGGTPFCSEGPVARMNVSSDGDHMAFVTADQITTYDNDGFAMMYTFDPHLDRIKCASCLPNDVAPTSDAMGSQNGLFMSNDGRVAFFTEDALVPRDTNKGGDTYEFVDNRAQLISSGTGVTNVSPDAFTGGAAFVFGQPGFYGMSADGADIYFSTFDTLVPGDRNGGMLKFYDARSGGGFATQAPRQACVAADECHGPEAIAPARPRFGTTADLGDRGNARPTRVCRTIGKKARGKRAAKKRKAAKRCRAAKRKRGAR